MLPFLSEFPEAVNALWTVYARVWGWPEHAAATVCRYGRRLTSGGSRKQPATDAFTLTCARCRICAGGPPLTGSAGCSAAPPAPLDASSHRSCPSGLLQRRAPWPCSSCSLSPESETVVSALLWESGDAEGGGVCLLFSFPLFFTSSRTTIFGCRTIWWILGSRFMFFSTYESWRAFFLSMTLMAT